MYAQGLPGANIAVVWGAGSECDPRPRHPLAGPGSARSSPGHLPGAAQGRRRAGGQEEAQKGWTPGVAARPALWGGARLCAVGSRVGVLPLPVLRPCIWGLGLFFTQSQVTFEVEELVSHEEGTRTDLVVTPVPLTFWVPACLGRGKESPWGW